MFVAGPAECQTNSRTAVCKSRASRSAGEQFRRPCSIGVGERRVGRSGVIDLVVRAVINGAEKRGLKIEFHVGIRR